ncbi:hypothetical protein PRIPAC_84373 [Pristionchus pacificus]|uniref:Serpentine receptor class gamma n=1 Tax=Pristionchus pacificus TaxID=54126 RepID=A0A2A6BVB6_PRIPA|nr:hypothetical protein PRIPAC_84373 [Pristionchus pacificus]|eukprot:PDM69701.1 G protein-coupled receptor [Pristionchus pacificus]
MDDVSLISVITHSPHFAYYLACQRKMRTTTLISLIYSVMGTVAYLMTIFAVVRLGKKTFSTAFISIYVIAAIVNLATHVNTWIMYRLRFEPASFGFYYEWMMRPEMDLAKWPAKADFVYNTATQVYDVSSNPKTSLIPVMIAMVSYGAVMLLICSIMSVCLQTNTPNCNAFSQMVSVSSLWNIHFSRIERNMTIIVLAVFAAQAANIVIVILNSISVFTRNWTTIALLSDVLPFMSDLFSLGPAAYTLLLPGPIREYYTRLFSRRSEMITSVTML